MHSLQTRIFTGSFAALLLVAPLAGWSAPTPTQTQIQAAYDRANQAMKFKYVDGVLSIRAGQYRAYDPGGRVIPPNVEVKRLQQLLASASSVTETTTITQFAQLSDKESKARINDIIQVTLAPNGNATARPPVLIRTVADDTWVRAGKDWKLESTRVLQQTATPTTGSAP